MNKQELLNAIERINDRCCSYAECELDVDESDYENYNAVIYQASELQMVYFQEDFTKLLLKEDVGDLLDDPQVWERITDCGWEWDAKEEEA